MKHVKVLGLAVIAASALMAVAVTSSASAVRICRPAIFGDGKCNTADAEKKVGFGETFEVTSTNAVLTNSLGNVSCEHSAMTIEISENEVSVIPGAVTALSFSKCKMSGGSECTFAAKNLPYTMSLSETLTIQDEVGAGGQLQCGFVCQYLTNKATFSVKNDEFTATNVQFVGTGVFCPKTATLDATYALTSAFTAEF